MLPVRHTQLVLRRTLRYSAFDAAPRTAQQPAQEDTATDIASTHHALLALLDSHNVRYALTHHKEVRTSEEAAEVRGATLASGAKAMLLAKDTDNFVLVVLSASEKLSWSKARKILGKKLNMATEEQVIACTGCLPGNLKRNNKSMNACVLPRVLRRMCMFAYAH